MKIPRLHLIYNWKATLLYAYSIKLNIFAGLCSVGEIWVAYYPDAMPRGAMAGAAALFTLGSLFARITDQKKVRE